jgi:hypothetical protein
VLLYIGVGPLEFERLASPNHAFHHQGKSNHHSGNKRYRQVVSEMKRTYQSTGAKTAKTDLSRAIVEHVVGYGGRFLKKDESTGQYFLLTKAQARRKTSQALRETKELKWTM